MYITTIKWLIRLLFENTVMVLITLSFVFSVLQHSPLKLMFYSHFKGVVFLSGCVWILSIKLTTKSKTIKTGIHKYLLFYFDGFFFNRKPFDQCHLQLDAWRLMQSQKHSYSFSLFEVKRKKKKHLKSIMKTLFRIHWTNFRYWKHEMSDKYE